MAESLNRNQNEIIIEHWRPYSNKINNIYEKRINGILHKVFPSKEKYVFQIGKRLKSAAIYYELLKERLDTASLEGIMDMINIMTIEFTVTIAIINIAGIIPLETISSENCVSSVGSIHHCMNIGI